MRLIALVVFACCLAAGLSEERRRYDGHQLLRIHPRGKAQLDFVYNNQDDPEMDYWYEGKERVDILVAPSRISQFKAQLSAKDIFYTVENADIQKDIDEEVERLMKKQSEPNRAFDYDDFNTFTDIIAELDALVARCPPTVSCETFVIGQSYEGRDLKGLKIFRTGSNRQAIWLDATIHAREWLATATHLKIVQHLIDDYQDVQVSDLLATYDFYLIPVNNPDGYTYTHTTERLWRKSRNPNSGSACIGTDLNRNYDQMWGNAGASTSPCSDTYRGSSAGSEPETQAVQSALRSVGSSLLFSLHFHTYGPYWLIPWGSVNPDGSCNYANDHDEMYYVANIVADAIQNTYNQDRWLRGNSCDTIYPASGITMDYSKGVAGVKYTVTPELRGNSFIVSNTQIQPSFVEVWNGFLTMVRTIEGLEKK